MAQHIKSRIRDQAFGQLLQKIIVKNRHIGSHSLIYQRMLDIFMGQYREIRHLGARTGCGGNRHKLHTHSAEIHHSLCAVHGAAATQCNDHIRTEFLYSGSSLSRQRNRRVRHYFRKHFHNLRTGFLCDPLCRAVFFKKRVRNHQQPIHAQLLQRRNRSGTAHQPCFTVKLTHQPTAFSKPVFPIVRKSCNGKKI